MLEFLQTNLDLQSFVNKTFIEERHTEKSRELVVHYFGVDDDRVSELWSIKIHDEADIVEKLNCFFGL